LRLSYQLRRFAKGVRQYGARLLFYVMRQVMHSGHDSLSLGPIANRTGAVRKPLAQHA